MLHRQKRMKKYSSMEKMVNCIKMKVLGHENNADGQYEMYESKHPSWNAAFFQWQHRKPTGHTILKGKKFI